MAAPVDPGGAVNTLYLCGAGNGEGVRLARLVNEASERWQQIVLLDDDVAKQHTERLGVPVIGGFERLADADPTVDEVVNLVTRTTSGRAAAREAIAAYGIPFSSLVHPGVELLGTRLAEEVTIYSNACVGADSTVARSCVVLVGAVVGHGTTMGQGCVIAPNAVINARVTLGDRVYVGSNASILPDVHIGDGATIAGNSLVVSDVPAGATALGVPATIVQQPSSVDIADGDMTEEHAPGTDAACGRDRDQLEAEIARAMSDLLHLVDVPHGANFFDLGGTSLAAVRLSQYLRAHLGLPARPLDLFEYPCVASLARHFADHDATSPAILSAQRRAARRRAPLRH